MILKWYAINYQCRFGKMVIIQQYTSSIQRLETSSPAREAFFSDVCYEIGDGHRLPSNESVTGVGRANSTQLCWASLRRTRRRGVKNLDGGVYYTHIRFNRRSASLICNQGNAWSQHLHHHWLPLITITTIKPSVISHHESPFNHVIHHVIKHDEGDPLARLNNHWTILLRVNPPRYLTELQAVAWQLTPWCALASRHWDRKPWMFLTRRETKVTYSRLSIMLSFIIGYRSLSFKTIVNHHSPSLTLLSQTIPNHSRPSLTV